ncbi:hypothetical protein, partial [Burkholderia gladioli]|uniref:hypothetical protein n=2 Tax=Burkholderia gladioli TaxID=28095 RepID=UPI001ABB4724
LIGCRFLKSVSAKQLGFFSSAAFSAAEKRDYDQHFAARQLLFSAPRSTHCVDHFSVKRISGQLLRRSTRPTLLPLSHRVSVSAKEA